MEPEPNSLPESNPAAEFGKVRQSAEAFGTVRHDAADFGNVPKGAEGFRTMPQAAAPVGTVREFLERRENHTLTVREVGRMFEAAGVARSERSIVNWCQPNRLGASRLDAFFDANERKYYITVESVERAIQEEIDRVKKHGMSPAPEVPQPAEAVRKDAEAVSEPRKTVEPDEVKALRQEVMDLKITNKAKDMFIDQLRNEREGLIHQVVDSSRKVGELETKLLALEAGPQPGARKIFVRSETDGRENGLAGTV